MRWFAALILVASMSGAHAAPKPVVIRQRGSSWATADINVAKGSKLTVEARLSHPGRWTADACYMTLGGSMLAAWQRPAQGNKGTLVCRRDIVGPAQGRMVVVVVSRERASSSTFTFVGGARNIRAGGRAALLTKADFSSDIRSKAVATLNNKAFAFFATGPRTNGQSLLSQAGPTTMTQWLAAGRSWALDDAWIIDGKPGTYDFNIELLIKRDWVLLTVADTR